ncbi:MAG: hypothetical protein ACYCYP_01850 [Leptospirales bacterium]
MVGKQLHGRIGELFRSGRKKKEIARLLGVDIKTVRKIVEGEEWSPYQRKREKEGLLVPYQEWIALRAPMGQLADFGTVPISGSLLGINYFLTLIWRGN